MKFNFKIQQYQTDAVNSVVNVFKGQPYQDKVSYRRDIGNKHQIQQYSQASFAMDGEQQTIGFTDDFDESGFKNETLMISADTLLSNIKEVQQSNNLMVSDSLVDNLGACSLDVEMETGTGKTYVYIKTMYELNQRYGWSKFIVVVPSIAIREGVKKSFEITQDHFMEQYHKKVRYFVYNSSNLNQLDSFSSNSGINVMIINMQAFNTSMKEGGRSKEARIIYDKRDEFGSRRPIDVIKANNPIIILDEPQKMGGDATQKALKNFNPLFCLNYSATHAQHHNLVYALDAVDAYNQRLVKKIEVKGFQVKNFRGTDRYLYLEDIIVSPKHAPKAKIEFEIAYKKSINREPKILEVDDNLYELSKNMEQYKGYRISEIDPIAGTVTFTNGEVIRRGDVVGDVSEKDMRRIQIRETIKSHLEKEEELFNRGIKTLSLFFIDEVAKYRQYDEDGAELLGEYGKMFEQEYNDVVNEYITVFDTPYQRYLKGIDVADTHKGYFSIDKKGRAVDSHIKRGSDFSDDISAYDLILKNKERLLSFKEPTRFIFSHSALREGWDSPNVFQICTLKHSESTTVKRQEVGRGLRLCVNQDGFRMDNQSLGIAQVHKVNKLTVIASESYKEFVTDLQKQIRGALYERPRRATKDYFQGKTVLVNGAVEKITDQQATMIYQYLIKNDYVTMDGEDRITEQYHIDLENNNLAVLPERLVAYAEGIHKLIQSVFNEKILDEMIGDGNETKIPSNDLNDNFYKKEFQTLWSYINHRYAYTVSFDSNELIQKSIVAIDNELYVSMLQYTTSVSEQKDTMSADAIKSGDSFKGVKSGTTVLRHFETSQIKYDLIGKIAEATVLTRKTVAAILKGIRIDRFAMYRNNPEEFITKVARLIKEQKATMIVEHISYDQLEGKYDSSIFTAEKHTSIDKAFEAEKHIQPYVFTDGIADKSIERKFAEDLDGASEVCVYAKLPKGFSIPTPVGNYSPDWAIAFNAGSVKHIFFIAETKGTMESLQLRPIEKAKISCARKLFNEISTENVVYHDVDSYQSLLNIMPTIEKKVAK
ncbi:DEAD/DEAH box helicase family protein [Lachnospiraceae bacterium MD1]|uniref:DEAD/DEAH box helicase family protein n=1 Tax=Variimorphobacter saccharofermentans TaxID=2755051 RepID=A0A839JZE9_9FIRM|nr:DEAD/DEAH box helicase family protein [Variimorphobacter saccharofermentans]MBB2182780.1 DEAD/DEAH box helicase family protein [Variimorphobacter saccharofermentans]